MCAFVSQVLFNVCDSYIRRSEGSDRVIGTLLGRYVLGLYTGVFFFESDNVITAAT